MEPITHRLPPIVGRREIPLLLVAPLVRNVLNGTKNVTRRPLAAFNDLKPGDVFWVRETWANDTVNGIMYLADVPNWYMDGLHPYDAETHKRGWKPSIHQPRTACGLLLEVTKAYTEPLHNITEEQARAEGMIRVYEVASNDPANRGFVEHEEGTYREGFRMQWNAIYGNWAENPTVWVAEFKILAQKRSEIIY